MLKHLDDKGLLRVVRWDGPSSIAVAEHNHHRPKVGKGRRRRHLLGEKKYLIVK
jgi:hypothetical protein